MPHRDMPPWLSGIYQALFAFLPWSIDIGFGSWNLTVPAEPLLAAAGIGLAVALVREKPRLCVPALAWVSACWIGWQAAAAFYSTIPAVSWKYWIVEAGQWWVFFVGILVWPDAWKRLIGIFTWSMAGVAVYAVAHHATYGFRTDQAALAPAPFFPDHTVFGAVFVLLSLIWAGARRHIRLYSMTLSPELPLCIFMFALVQIPSRGAWLSLLLAIWVGLLWYSRFSRRWALAGAVLVLSGILFYRENILQRIAGDVSTQERLNRHSCAVRMASARPWTGFGPGTFAFQYLPYQQPGEMTRLSIRQPGPGLTVPLTDGRAGGVHSEYLQALSELGWPGLVIWLVLVVGSWAWGFRQYFSTRDGFVLFITLALLSFFLHGLVNNFLHDARVAALVWGGVAVLKSKCKM